ncbi:MAG: SHOCT domain-containing protein [Sedimentibacter sp.]
MGLFSNNKKPCPICGNATPRLLATHIENKTPICSDCSSKISMVNGKIDELSLEGLKKHLAMREENAKYLENIFRPNKKISIGWTNLNIDEANRIFTIPLNMCGNTNNPPVFKFEELIGYELVEEQCVIERFNKGDVAPQITPMVYIPVIHVNHDDKDNKQEDITHSFKLNLYLSNSCWDKVESSAGSASGDEYSFQIEHSKHLSELHMITSALTAIIGVGEKGNSVQNNANSVAEGIKTFKELLDGGIITQEEFNLKKKQLLGI